VLLNSLHVRIEPNANNQYSKHQKLPLMY
jgi:hypothetical protein